MIDFKTQRIREEWAGDKVHKNIKNLVSMLSYYMELEHGRDVVITDLLRTQEEQDEYYKNDKKYKKKPWKSVHQYGRGVDIRSHGLEQKTIEMVLNFLNMVKYDQARPHKKTAIHHDIGLSGHFHIQCMD